MNIREFAKQRDHKVVGKLTRRPEYEYTTDCFDNKRHSGIKTYIDEGGNAYYVSKTSVCIVTTDGAVI